MEGKKVKAAKEELIQLNDKFHKSSLVTEAFYNQLMQRGFAYRQCLLVAIFPDGSNTYCGQLIRQDGNVFDFDIDLDSAEYSSWKDVTDSFRQIYERNKAAKPWLKEVVAYNLFKESQMTTYDYRYIEDLLLRLLALLLEIFTDSEKSEVQNFIDAGEYGQALDTLVDIVIKEDKQIPGESLVFICELADVMQLDKKVFQDKLRGHVADS